MSLAIMVCNGKFYEIGYPNKLVVVSQTQRVFYNRLENEPDPVK